MLSYITPVAICYVLGVYLCSIFPTLDYSEIIAIAVILSCISLFSFKNKKKLIIVSLFSLCFGVLSYTNATKIKDNKFYDLCGKYITLEGYICDIPEKNGDNYSYKLQTVKAEYLGKEYPEKQVVRVSSQILLNYGENVSIKGFLEEFSEANNSSDFNFKRYYMSRGIFYKMYARELTSVEPTVKSYSLSYYLNLYKVKLCEAIDKNFNADSAAILKAIAAGNKHQFSSEFEKFLIDNGMMKFFYPSFLHIYLISILTGIIFKRFKKDHRDTILIIFMLIYASINCYYPVFIKNAALVILSILFLKKFGFSHKPDLLAITTLALGITNPLYYFEVSFIMSVANGILFYYYYKDILEGLLSFIPSKGIRNKLGSYIITTFLLLPLTAYYFGSVNLYINLLSPLYALVLLMMIFLIMLMSIFGTIAIINHLISSLLWYFITLPELISRIPFSRILVKPPSVIFIIAFFITLYLLYALYLREIKKSRNIFIAVICLGLWFSIILTNILNIANLEITFVNVGQGDGAIINMHGGETLLVDSGGKSEFSSYDPGKEIFLPYLLDNGYTNIDKAIISHCHSDHCSGILAAIETINIEEIVMPKTLEKNEYQEKIEKAAREKNIPITYVCEGDVLNFSSGMSIVVHSPSETEILNKDENETSIVMEVQYKGFKCLFTGDIGKETEARLTGVIDDTDVVKMAHHGSSNSNSREFADVVKAEYAIASVGENNMYGFPKADAVFNYQASGAKVIRTDTNGDITIRVSPNGEYKIFKNSI